MAPGGLVLDLHGGPGRLLRVRAHGHLVDVAPERAEVHVPGRPDADEVRVDGVVALAGGGRHARGAVVGPRAGLHRRRRRVADRGVLRTERRDAVVQVIQVPYFYHLRGLDDGQSQRDGAPGTYTYVRARGSNYVPRGRPCRAD